MATPTTGTSAFSNPPPDSARKSRGGRPTKEAAAQMERRILDAAASLFAAQGYTATSMEQVADACNAGKDTLYRRYPSKGALFTALMDACRTDVLAELQACASPSGLPLERLRHYARLLLEINLRPQLLALNRVAIGEAIPSKGVQPTPTADDPFMRHMAGLVREAQADGAIIDGDALFIAEQLLYATSIKPLIATMLGESGYTKPSDRQAYFDRAWRLFVDGAQPRPG